MPNAYQHLRVRLRAEQIRLLKWGEKIGFVEELLDKPSQALGLNRNLIIDILLEIQAVFRDSLQIQGRFDKFVPSRASPIEVVAHTLGKDPVEVNIKPPIDKGCGDDGCPTRLILGSQASANEDPNLDNHSPRACNILLTRGLKLFEKAPRAAARLQ